ncbi:MAG: DedA family protein [Patescibacteria group bacterium]|nr:DedA family protein [Patescibacteria group bacterium]MDE2438325.1 DedA family protein [Patescibacteria group bacterium]
MDPTTLLHTFGYVGLAGIVFAETGLFFGFFLPGDTLLFAAGILSAQGEFRIGVVCTLVIVAAVLGDMLGYFVGKAGGRRVFVSETHKFFHKQHVARAEAFYERYGKSTVVIGRFFPIVRSFVPTLAGIGRMFFPLFFLYDVLGIVGWMCVFVFSGFYFGIHFPNLESHIALVLGLIFASSFLPIIIHTLRDRWGRKQFVPD